MTEGYSIDIKKYLEEYLEDHFNRTEIINLDKIEKLVIKNPYQEYNPNEEVGEFYINTITSKVDFVGSTDICASIIAKELFFDSIYSTDINPHAKLIFRYKNKDIAMIWFDDKSKCFELSYNKNNISYTLQSLLKEITKIINSPKYTIKQKYH